MGKNTLFAFIAVLIIILGLGIAVYKNANNNSSAPPSAPANTQEITQPSANLLQVNNQPAGTSVRAEEADLLQNGFVVIKDASGKVLGASPILAAGKNTLVFTPAVVSKGKTYYAYLYGDNGDAKFGNGDVPLKDVSNNQIVIPFKAF